MFAKLQNAVCQPDACDGLNPSVPVFSPRITPTSLLGTSRVRSRTTSSSRTKRTRKARASPFLSSFVWIPPLSLFRQASPRAACRCSACSRPIRALTRRLVVAACVSLLLTGEWQVGYCQGLGFPTAIFLMYLSEEVRS